MFLVDRNLINHFLYDIIQNNTIRFIKSVYIYEMNKIEKFKSAEINNLIKKKKQYNNMKYIL